MIERPRNENSGMEVSPIAELLQNWRNDVARIVLGANHVDFSAGFNVQRVCRPTSPRMFTIWIAS
jgi:hypothetical protein